MPQSRSIRAQSRPTVKDIAGEVKIERRSQYFCAAHVHRKTNTKACPESKAVGIQARAPGQVALMAQPSLPDTIKPAASTTAAPPPTLKPSPLNSQTLTIECLLIPTPTRNGHQPSVTNHQLLIIEFAFLHHSTLHATRVIAGRLACFFTVF